MPYRPTVADRVQRAGFAALQRLPRRLVRRLAGPPVICDGQTLDPQTQLGLRILNRLGERAPGEQTLAEARKGLQRSAYVFAGRPPQPGLIQELTIPGRGGPLRARLYRPDASADPRHRLPLVVWLHGGGWVLGDLDSHDPVCRHLCLNAGVIVLAVDYRLAPEHPFPAAVHDALDAFAWVAGNAGELGADPERLAVAGDSAGANLAAVVALETTVAGETAPSRQLLFAPALDPAHRPRSHELFGRGYLLTSADIDWFQAQYLGPDGDVTDPRVAPLLAPDLAGLPPAYLAVAGFDPLRDEGVAYAQRLRQAGVPVTLRLWEGAVHQFIGAVTSHVGKAAMADAAEYLRSW